MPQRQLAGQQRLGADADTRREELHCDFTEFFHRILNWTRGA